MCVLPWHLWQQSHLTQEGERARQRAAEEEAAKARARSAPPPMQDELEALIGDLAGSNKKVRTCVCVYVCVCVLCVCVCVLCVFCV